MSLDANTAAERILHSIRNAAIAALRDPQSVTLIAVIKGQPIERIRNGLQSDITHLGENYLNEALEHQQQLGRDDYTWHYIGHIQSNKTRAIATHFDWVHTIDRIKIADRLNDQRSFHGPALQVCIQINLWNEPTKGGITPNELISLAQFIQSCPRLKLRGLMALPPDTSHEAEQRQHFESVVREYQRLRDHGFELDTLSMGMSGDYVPAIQAGATHIRIGSALFGARSIP